MTLQKNYIIVKVENYLMICLLQRFLGWRYGMKSYEKPVILVNEELAEGVYAASGAVSDAGGGDSSQGGSSGGVTVSSVEQTDPGNQWNKVSKNNVTIANPGNVELADWSATVSVTSGTATAAQVYNGWQASASLSGNTITIKPGGGGVIPAGGSITVEVVVSYSSDSVTVK